MTSPPSLQPKQCQRHIAEGAVAPGLIAAGVVPGWTDTGKGRLTAHRPVSRQKRSPGSQACHRKQRRLGLNGRHVTLTVPKQQVCPGGRGRHIDFITPFVAQGRHQVHQPTLGGPVVKRVSRVAGFVESLMKYNAHGQPSQQSVLW